MPSAVKIKLVEKKDLTPEVLFLSFQAPENFVFQAGQFVILVLKQDAIQMPRSYSILNPPPESGKLDFCVKIIAGGFASRVFSEMTVGTEITAKGPFGHFVFDQKTENEHWFIGGGTGVAPLYCMIKEHLRSGKKMKLIFGEKTPRDLLFHDEFLRLKARFPNFDYLPTISRGTWNGKKGRVQQHLGGDLQNKTFYICGLKELVLETKRLLLSKGVKSENIHYERYS